MNKIINNFIQYHSKHNDLLIRAKDIIEHDLIFSSFKMLFFINPSEKVIIEEFVKLYDHINVSFISNFINNERSLVIIHHSDYIINNDNFLKIYCFKYNLKFNVISHRDVLGALLNLKIDRHLLGDIYINNDIVYFEVAQTISKYILDNLNRINKVNVLLIEEDNRITIIKEYQEFKVIINSLRLDNVIKSIIKSSSLDAKKFIIKGNVKVNYSENDNLTYQVTNNDLLSLRGYGRYYLEINEGYRTKKNKYIIILKKVI
ncbi:MAG: hypothetical protein LBT75_01545 [Bacilli bacterium]|jgi:RNA-binding protein YlmH|nr:hypothetical protein [Bacilli bacterium]